VRAVLVLDERDAQQDPLLDSRAETHDEPLVLMRQRRAVNLVHAHFVELLVCAGHVEVARERDVAPGGEAALEHVAHLHLDGLLGRRVIETPLELMSARNLMTKSMPDLPHFLRHRSERCWLAKSLRKKLRYARSTFSMVSFDIL
jgi:hypothetical protein